MFEPDGITPAERLPWAVLEQLKQEIEATPETMTIASQWFKGDAAASLARVFVYRLFDKVQPRQIVADFLDFGERTALDILLYIGLFGGGIDQAIEFDEGLSVMPAALSPPSLIRESIFGLNRFGRMVFQRDLGGSWKPNIALILRDQRDFRESENIDRFQSNSERVERAIRALTLASGYAFVRSWQASWIDHPAIPYEGFGAWNASGAFASMPFPRNATPVDAICAREMYRKLGVLPPAVKEPINLATDRLARSRIHGPSADSALDLEIASEVILLHGMGNNSELRYRLSLRGAYLVSNDGHDRETSFRVFQALYDARSQVAHTGTLTAEAQNRIPEFDALCLKAIKAIVNSQKFPDWNRMTLGLS